MPNVIKTNILRELIINMVIITKNKQYKKPSDEKRLTPNVGTFNSN